MEWGSPTVSVSFPCLSCDYVMLAPDADSAFGLPFASGWRLIIRWAGGTASLKEAALLKQFIPSFRQESISEVRQQLGRGAEWKLDGLSEPAARELRKEAEARGFTVDVRSRGEDRPRVRLPRPGSGMTGYCVRLSPSFDDKGHILATFGPAGSAVSIACGPSTAETVDVPNARGLQFLEEVTALDPLGIPDVSSLGLDGISLECLVQEARGNHRFFAWSPSPDSSPRQHGFVMALFRLAMDVAQVPATVEYLEQVFGYVSSELPVKVFEETPRRIRLFGGLSSYHLEALQSLFDSVGPGEPVLMDLSNSEGMGTLLHPLFARFHARMGRTVWWVNAPAARHLGEAGIPRDCLYEEFESARAALLSG
ncbi:hypothetical protein [Hyalangium rubrum]|uniref:STAS domain-containing protein n=1 Tax=Hyalangium rubrum TaxID=3103134 RepID=A0ABU5HG91_9BACT|nr:hypothetical protein [Hyalangium sp. s54d21]MDY7232474.1 hypothetical protein [Hyalangium sp. s54d21]